MVRPRKIKNVEFAPDVTYFKPQGIPLRELEEVEITVDELETIRLSGLEKKGQIDAAEKMDVHQSTFNRTLARAREKIADALVNGKAIKIQGGEYKMPRGDGTGPFRGQGRGDMKGNRYGPQGNCTCPKCGHSQPHQRGQPCNQTDCPKCGTKMVRG